MILNYRSGEEAARAVAARITAAGGAAELCPFDVADAAAAAAALARLTADENRPIAIVVNNAGVARDAPFPALEPAAWEVVTRTTLDGFYNVTRPLVMPMVRLRFGRIINISSVSGVMGHRGQVNYAAAKAGLIGATRALAQEVAHRGVTVNAIAPGLIDTDMIAGAPVDEILKRIPARRLGRPEEVASGRLPRLRGGRVHHGPGDRHQRRPRLTSRCRAVTDDTADYHHDALLPPKAKELLRAKSPS